MLKSIFWRLGQRIAFLGLCLTFSCSALAALQTYSFPISGPGGISGSGSFTWDDAVYPAGTFLNIGNLTALTMTLQGGAIGAPQTFTLAQCTSAWLDSTPNFATDINFNCDNGTLRVAATSYPRGASAWLNGVPLPGGGNAVDFVVGSVVAASAISAVPTLSQWAMIALACGIALTTLRLRTR